MSEIMSGNWNKMPWREIRDGIKQVTLAMGADDCTVTIGQVVAGHAKRPHSHPEEQVALVISGECDYYVDGVPHRLTPGGFVVVPGGVEHYIDVHDTDITCFQMDIFGTPRPEFKETYTKFIEELGFAAYQ
ncbi:MAG: cupin domain-containing protein [Clostridiales Family XIII bacterium]|jgi:quercetin dioxygenase-like cupin family protein|nr:cupin domain-containing protein [Clostridiales Family XIII bacterium]